MKLDFQVHSIARGDSTVMATINGKEREVKAEMLTVELVGESSVITLRLDDIEEAEKLFKKRDQKVTLTIAGVK